MYAPTPNAPTLLSSGLPSAIFRNLAQSCVRNGNPLFLYITCVTTSLLELDISITSLLLLLLVLVLEEVVIIISAVVASASFEFCSSSR